jgi:hypothetical protein
MNNYNMNIVQYEYNMLLSISEIADVQLYFFSKYHIDLDDDQVEYFRRKKKIFKRFFKRFALFY